MLLENTELIQTAESIAEEKGIEKELVFEAIEKAISKAGKVKFLLVTFFSLFIIKNVFAETLKKSETTAELSVLDKVSSKNINIKIKIGEEFSFQNLSIKVLKCYNSEFDDDPEVTAYMQVKDKTMNNNDKVFVFNDWTFASSPSIRPFDHPVYDVWLKKCYT